MDKIFLIDGSSMLTTHYHATLPIPFATAKTPEEKAKAATKIGQTTDGIYTNGIYGMTKSLLKLIKDEKPDYMAVCWDVSRETFRREIYPAYKAHRSDPEIQLTSQLDYTHQMLNYIGIPSFRLERYEADDLIGTIAAEMSKENKVIVITKDQDALQLINDNTTVWLGTKSADQMIQEAEQQQLIFEKAPFNYFPYTESTFEYFYGLKPKQIIDLKAIDGDKSDGIPGISGYGVKTITPLLQTYKTIEALYDFVNNTEIKVAEQAFKEAKIKTIKPEKLLLNEEQVRMSKKLATIHCSIEAFKDQTKQDYKMEINPERQRKIFERLQFKSLL